MSTWPRSRPTGTDHYRDYRDYRARIEPLLAAPIAPDILDMIEP
jgi:hypothetical protein